MYNCQDALFTQTYQNARLLSETIYFLVTSVKNKFLLLICT